MNVKAVTLKHYILNMVCVIFYYLCMSAYCYLSLCMAHSPRHYNPRCYSSLIERKANSSISQRQINDEHWNKILYTITKKCAAFIIRFVFTDLFLCRIRI